MGLFFCSFIKWSKSKEARRGGRTDGRTTGSFERAWDSLTGRNAGGRREEAQGRPLASDRPGLGWDSSALALNESARGRSHSSHSTSCRELTFRQWRQHQVDGLQKRKRDCQQGLGRCGGQDACHVSDPGLNSVKWQMISPPAPPTLIRVFLSKLIIIVCPDFPPSSSSSSSSLL